MLVLSRGLNDRICFPALGISVEVLKMNGTRASLGVTAPKSIRVVRHELLEDDTDPSLPDAGTDELKRLRHETRNQVNRASLKLQLAAKMLESGANDDALKFLTLALSELDAIHSGSQASVEPSEPLADSNPITSSGKRVLLVDDDVNERTLMACYLKRCGFEVIEADDGLAALYQLSKCERPDVVLMDMNMPNLNGNETVQRIRSTSQHPTVPVFAVTGESRDTDGVIDGEDGFTAWFQKPVQADALVAAIESTLLAV